MTTSIVECPHCHYRFNYEFIPGASFYSIRLGPDRLFRCPHCRELHAFNITHFGSDPSLPAYGDNSETGVGGRIWALMVGPLFALIAVGFLFQFAFGLGIPFLLGPIVVGIIWTLVYTVYLIQRSRRDVSKKGK